MNPIGTSLASFRREQLEKDLRIGELIEIEHPSIQNPYSLFYVLLQLGGDPIFYLDSSDTGERITFTLLNIPHFLSEVITRPGAAFDYRELSYKQNFSLRGIYNPIKDSSILKGLSRLRV